MKIRFSKVATLFLAGAALLAAGCTDYQSDINDIYVKIDDLASKESVATLQNQVVVLSNALDALKSDHSKDIAALQSSIDALKSADAQFTSQIAALDGKIGDNAKDIASLKTALANTDKTIADHVAAFNEYKTQVQSALTELSKKDTELAGKIEAAETALRAEIAAVQKLVEAEAATRADADKVLGERIDAALKEIAAESNRAQLKEKELQDAIDAEVAARKAADEAAAAALAAEVKRAEDAEALLDAAIKAEEKARAAADEVLTKRIAAEERAREVADSLLNEAIKAEAIARDEAIKAAVKAEAEARIEADSLLQAYAESIDKKVDDLRTEYDAFKADVEGEIAGLKTRLDAAEAAIKNIDASIKTINGQIKDLQKADSLLRVDMEAGDQYVLDSLNVVKAATEKSIAALQNAVKDIVAVNKDQSDSLKAAFAKFNDYVLTKTFEAYQAEVEAALKAKADTAALNAAIERIDDHDLRIVALELYKKQLVDTIIPGLKDADKALRKDLDSLGGVVAKVQADVAGLQSRMTAAESTLAEHTTAIANLNNRTSALEEWQVEAEKNIQSLLSRIRSVEFVPDYTDGNATIEQVLMPVVRPNDSDKPNRDTMFVFNAPSEITYKVYPTTMADSLVNYFKQHKNDGSFAESLYFDVVKVKNSGNRFETTEHSEKAKLEILDIVSNNDRTPGAITFKVKAKNIEDFNLVFAEYAMLFYASPYDPVDYLGRLLPRNENTENFEPFYASALVIENPIDGGAITSEYNIWTPGLAAFFYPPFFGVPDKTTDYGVRSVEIISEEIEYTDIETVHSLADSVDLYTMVYPRGGEEHANTFAEALELLDIDATADFAARRVVDCNHTDAGESHNAVFYINENESDRVSLYGYTADLSAFTPAIDEFTKLKSQLNKDSAVTLRKAAIGDVENITYTANLNGTQLDWMRTELKIIKTKAVAVVDTIKINWEYLKDVDVDAAIFNMGGKPLNGIYSREGIVLSINEEKSNLTDKGVKISDFDGASAKLTSYTVKDKSGKVVAEFEGVEDLVIKLELNDKKNPTAIVASISNFVWDEEYTVSAVYDLGDAEVEVSGVIVTKDRPRTPITLNYGTYTTEYKKDMNFQVRACMTFGGGIGYHTPSHENFTTSPINVRDSIVALYGPTANVPDSLHKDLWKNGADKAFVVPTGVESFYVDSRCVNKLYNVLYSNYKKAGDVVEYPDVRFYTYYGQEIIVKAKSTVTAPKYDFRHNIYRVFDDGTTETESHPTSNVKVSGRFYSNVEPAYNADKWNNFSKFNVAAINLPEAFRVVDDTLGLVSAEDQVAAGLKVSFELESKPACQDDGRDNTYITIRDNMLMYHGWDEKVAVYGSMAIVNSDGTKFSFPTSFDAGFEAIYAAKLADDDLKVGRYADYEVVKFNPLHDFKSTKDVTLQVFDAKMYTTNVLENLSLLDQRKFDPNDPTTPPSLDGNTIKNGVELFDGKGNWKLGTGANLFAKNVKANVAYDIASEFKKEISDDVHEDIKNAVNLRTDEKTGVVYFDFNYTQQIVLTQPVLVNVNAELTQPWEKDPLTATVKVTITK